MNKAVLLLWVVILTFALLALTLPATAQAPTGSSAPAVNGAPAMPAGGPPGGKPAGPPGMGGVPAAAKGHKPGPNLSKSAPKVGLIGGLIAVIAIGAVLAMKKRK